MRASLRIRVHALETPKFIYRVPHLPPTPYLHGKLLTFMVVLFALEKEQL